MNTFINKAVAEYKLKFNEVLHRMYNLEIVPEIQSRINERIPERGGFQLFVSEDLEIFLTQKLEHLAKQKDEEFMGMLEDEDLEPNEDQYKRRIRNRIIMQRNNLKAELRTRLAARQDKLKGGE